MSLVNAISGAITGGLTGGWTGAGVGLLSGLSQDYNNIQQKKAITDQNRMTLASWHMQNEYNSPVQQMARLKEAGLNPMLVYGGGNVSGNSSTSIGSMGTYADNMNSMAGIQGVQAIADLENTKANTNNTKQSTAQSEANTLATYQDITNMQTANKIQQAQLQQEQQAVQMGAMDLEIAKKEQANRLRDVDFYKTRQGIIKAQLKREGLWNESGAGDVEYGMKKALGLGKDFMELTSGLAGTQAGFARAMSYNGGYTPRYRR